MRVPPRVLVVAVLTVRLYGPPRPIMVMVTVGVTLYMVCYVVLVLMQPPQSTGPLLSRLVRVKLLWLSGLRQRVVRRREPLLQCSARVWL